MALRAFPFINIQGVNKQKGKKDAAAYGKWF